MTVVAIVESSLILLKINNGRVRSILRFFPFVSLILDFLLNSFSIGYWLNPLNCYSCIQKILLTLFFPELKHYLYTNEISHLNYLGGEISHTIFSVVFVLFSAMTFYFTLQILFAGLIVARSVRSKMKSNEICSCPIENLFLANALKKHHVTVFSNDIITIPMATFSKTIFLPINIIKELPQEEFEAIIAHELEHVIWKDPAIKLLTQLISAIFWWVPTKFWQKKLEFDQEIACDQSVLKYGLKEEFLASALVKVAKTAKEKPHHTLCYLSNKKHLSLIRVQIMLGESSPNSRNSKWISYLIVALGSLIGALCVLWL